MELEMLANAILLEQEMRLCRRLAALFAVDHSGDRLAASLRGAAGSGKPSAFVSAVH